jgi:DNA replication protein DnaC
MTTKIPPIPPLNLEHTRRRLRALKLYGLATQLPSILHEPWLVQLLDIEESERQARSLKRRMDDTRLGEFKPLADFDWDWPQQCDRALVEELSSLQFLTEAANVVMLGPNGVGKTMIAKNIVHQAVLAGHSARFTLASDMLHDLAAQDSSSALARRLRRYTGPALLAIDEIGYLSYDSRYADLLFEVVSRRYQRRSVLLTTNKPFGEWSEMFPNASCVVTLIDRLVHRAEILDIKGESYRLKEAKERNAAKAKARSTTSATKRGKK